MKHLTDLRVMMLISIEAVSYITELDRVIMLSKLKCTIKLRSGSVQVHMVEVHMELYENEFRLLCGRIKIKCLHFHTQLTGKCRDTLDVMDAIHRKKNDQSYFEALKYQHYVKYYNHLRNFFWSNISAQMNIISINSLAHGKFEYNFRWEISKPIWVIGGYGRAWSFSCEPAPRKNWT